MSSPYPILYNCPIDQWKVTELKEELGWRSLKINGLKEELVRWLADALHTEMEEAEKEHAERENDEKEELGDGTDPGNDPDDKDNVEVSAPVPKEYSAEQIRDEVDEEKSAPPPPKNSAEPVEDTSSRDDNDAVMVDNTDSTIDTSQITGDQGQKEMGRANLDAVVEDSTYNVVPSENSMIDSQTGVIQAESSDKDMRSDEKNEDSKPSAEDASDVPTIRSC